MAFPFSSMGPWWYYAPSAKYNLTLNRKQFLSFSLGYDFLLKMHRTCIFNTVNNVIGNLISKAYTQRSGVKIIDVGPDISYARASAIACMKIQGGTALPADAHDHMALLKSCLSLCI